MYEETIKEIRGSVSIAAVRIRNLQARYIEKYKSNVSTEVLGEVLKKIYYLKLKIDSFAWDTYAGFTNSLEDIISDIREIIGIIEENYDSTLQWLFKIALNDIFSKNKLYYVDTQEYKKIKEVIESLQDLNDYILYHDSYKEVEKLYLLLIEISTVYEKGISQYYEYLGILSILEKYEQELKLIPKIKDYKLRNAILDYIAKEADLSFLIIENID